MTLLETVKRLREMEQRATPERWGYNLGGEIFTEEEVDIDGEGDRIICIPHDSFDAEFIARMRNAAPAMLAVLSCFREGDCTALGEIADVLEEAGFVAKAAYARRMQEAARRMEE